MSSRLRRAASAARRAAAQHPVRTVRARALVAFPWEIGHVRYLWLTRWRTRTARAYACADGNTREVEYSRAYLDRYAPDRRVQWTMFLLASIPDCPRDSLLVVGPRYEPEILMARGLGWDPAGVRGLDTFSYSPLIDVGDMHDLPYADSSYGSLICSWTLSYSARPDLAASEMMRVLRPGGYLVVSMQKIGPDYTDTLPGVLAGSERVQTLAQLDSLYAGLQRVAGFEPDVPPGGYGHTIAAYHKRA